MNMFQLCSAAKSLLSQGAQNRKLLHSKHISEVNFRNANKGHVTLDISYFALSYIVLISVVIRFFQEVRLLKNPQGENVGGKIQQIQDNL